MIRHKTENEIPEKGGQGSCRDFSGNYVVVSRDQINTVSAGASTSWCKNGPLCGTESGCENEPPAAEWHWYDRSNRKASDLRGQNLRLSRYEQESVQSNLTGLSSKRRLIEETGYTCLKNLPVRHNAYISILLMAFVAFCPFQCIFGGCLTDNVGNGVSVESGCCGLCGPSGEDRSAPCPSSPDDCPCGDCFCQGALPINDISDDAIVAELVSFLTHWVELETAGLESPAILGQSIQMFASPFDVSAVELRAALSCWII